jgi:lipopolysaccharide/colanic/teichoic acid biosynthesis glycosyltransferase
MIDYFFKRVLRLQFHVFVLLLASWTLFHALIAPTQNVPEWMALFFTLGSSIFSFIGLSALGYFNLLRLTPRKSDVLTAIFTMAVAGTLQEIAIRLFFMHSVAPISFIIGGSIALGCLVFLGHLALGLILQAGGTRINTVLHLLPDERQNFLYDLKNLELEKSVHILGLSELKELFLKRIENEIDLIVLSRKAATQFERDPVLIRAHLAGIPFIDYEKLSTSLSGRVRLSEVEPWSYVLHATPQTLLLRLFSAAKILLEPAIAFILFIILSPVMLLVALVVRISSPGPVLFKQIRVGYLGQVFILIKFRSMRIDAEVNGPQWSSGASDTRVTAVGRFIRRTRLDELPQLWNVMKGDMGFLGPRPERPEIHKELIRDIPLFSMRTVVRPGITGWAQVWSGYASTVQESRVKLEYDLYYIQNISPRLDLVILIKTLEVMLMGDRVPVNRNELSQDSSQRTNVEHPP